MYTLVVDIDRFQWLAVIGSVLFLGFIFYLIRAKRMREDYAIMWLVLGFVFLLLSSWRESLDHISRLIGIAYPPAAIFIILIMCLIMIAIQYSLIISRQSNQITRLAQEIALLKKELNDLKKSDESNESSEH